MKRTMKITALVMAALMAVMMLAGCGAKTLEEKLNSDSDTKSEIEKIEKQYEAQSGIDDVDISAKENTLIMKLKVAVTTTDTTVDVYKNAFVSSFKNSESSLKSAISDLEDDTKIDGVKMQVIVVDQKDVELFNKTYDKNGEVTSK